MNSIESWLSALYDGREVRKIQWNPRTQLFYVSLVGYTDSERHSLLTGLECVGSGATIEAAFNRALSSLNAQFEAIELPEGPMVSK